MRNLFTEAGPSSFKHRRAGSLKTLRWREPDSNRRSRLDGRGFRNRLLSPPPLITSTIPRKRGILLPVRPRSCGLVLDEAGRPETLLVLF
jgi:hypothetical protein